MGDISDYKNKKNLHRDYQGPLLTQEEVDTDPIKQFETWFQKALGNDLTDANAMTLATASQNGIPSARTVLLKEFDSSGFRFYTNYESRKGKELIENPQAALCFYWAELNRQIRIEGSVKKVPKGDSAAYFAKRPRNSQLSAWASKQDNVLSSRDELEEDFKKVKKRFEGRDVELPDYWGGFILQPNSIEFWQGRPSRLHDRILYTKKDNNWKISRLSP